MHMPGLICVQEHTMCRHRRYDMCIKCATCKLLINIIKYIFIFRHLIENFDNQMACAEQLEIASACQFKVIGFWCIFPWLLPYMLQARARALVSLLFGLKLFYFFCLGSNQGQCNRISWCRCLLSRVKCYSFYSECWKCTSFNTFIGPNNVSEIANCFHLHLNLMLHCWNHKYW